MNRAPTLLRYGVVPLAVVTAMLLRWPLWGVLQGDLAFLFFWPAVMFCAWYGGLGPGLLATALSALAAAYFLIEPRFSFAVTRPADLVGTGVFVSMGVFISFLNEKLHRGRRQAERNAEEVARQREWLRVSLTSIGDAVIACDREGRVSFLNPVAGDLTGWSPEGARGRPLGEVFPIINEETRRPAENPVARVLREGVVVGLANHTALVAKDGTERAIEDSAAPIRGGDGGVAGVILVFRDVTEKRRLEKALEERRREEAVRQSEERFRLMIEGVQDYAIFMLDTEGRVATWNAGAQRIKGYQADEIIGQHFSRFYTPEAVQARWPDEGLRRATAGGRFEDEGWRVRKDGSRFWANVVITALKDSAGRPRGFSKVTRDLTELKRREEELRQLHRDLERRVEDRTAALAASTEALRESEERFRAAFDHAAVGVALVGMDGRTLWFNRGLCGMLGYDEAAFAGLSSADVTHPDDLEADLDLQRRVAAGGLESARYEKRYVHRDGHTVWGDLSVSLVRDAAGGPKYVVGVVVDATQRKAAEAALRESEEQFRTLADSIPQLAWAARADGHIDWYNRRWYEYTGTTLGQMEGWGWQSVHDPEELPRVLARWRTSIATGEAFDMVFPLKGKDGRFRPFLTRVVPLRGEGGRVLRWFGTNTDVSEIKEMEERLREADRRKDQFVMMLAHELRNPLAPIRTAIQIIEKPEADRVTVEKARGMVERQVRHLTRIVDDLLDVSRVQSGKMSLRTERLDLARLARVVAEDNRPAFGRAGLTPELAVPDVPVWVDADPTRLTQVLDNLLQNAAKFTDRGGAVAVRVGADAGRRQAVLTVRDTGVGIEADVLPRLFQTFSQADRSLDRSKGGLGLGLSLVKGLVELHGGTVEARSDGPGRGTEFVVRLPLQPEPAAVTGMPDAPKRAPRRLRVLVVEDHRDAADSLKMLLVVFGYEVTVAYTGPAGVEAARAWKPDVVLCDIGLPGMNGFDVVRALREDPATAHARMIAVTGYGSDEDRLKTREAGFDAHLTKPADPTALQELLAAGDGAPGGPLADGAGA